MLFYLGEVLNTNYGREMFQSNHFLVIRTLFHIRFRETGKYKDIHEARPHFSSSPLPLIHQAALWGSDG